MPPKTATDDTLSRARFLELSDERDAWHRAAMARERDAYRAGYAAGVAEGLRRAEQAEAAAWHRIAVDVAKGAPHSEMERRRWGPGGRECFADPRPGDYPGREATA